MEPTNIEMYAGDDVRFTFTLLQDDGTAFSLDNVTNIVYAAFESAVDGTQIFSKSLGSGIEISSSDDGEFQLSLDDTDTEGYGGKYYHEMELTDSSAGVITAFTGWLELVPTRL